MTLEERLQDVEDRLNNLETPSRFTIKKILQLFDGRNIQVGNSVGTKIGLTSTAKLSVYGVATVIQAAAISAPTTQGGIYNQTDANTIVTAVNSIRTALKNFGITA